MTPAVAVPPAAWLVAVALGIVYVVWGSTYLAIRVMVEDLAHRFDVTLQTIRRDLSDLADAGHLDRVHGGAMLRTGVANIGYEARRKMNEGAKAAIARACAASIPDNCSLILNLGTTTEAVARRMQGRLAPLITQ